MTDTTTTAPVGAAQEAPITVITTAPWRPAAIVFLALTLITGVVYPLVVTALGGALFPAQAAGSLLVDAQGNVVGSALLGQNFASDRYFTGRPSASGYGEAAEPGVIVASSGSNLSPASQALADLAAEREAAFRAAHSVPADVAVPIEMLFASASGLDPHISPEAARLQIGRVAAARSLDRETVAALVEAAVEAPVLGVLGEPRVNVLLLNRALDEAGG
jgi:K+-transporting ATPase ATPase C chain